jgi:hypothetical protein
MDTAAVMSAATFVAGDDGYGLSTGLNDDPA